MQTLYYHKDFSVSDKSNYELFESYRDFFANSHHVKVLTNHTGFVEEKYQEELEGDTDFQRGKLVEPTACRFLHLTKFPTSQINTVVPNHNGVLVIAWISIFQMTQEVFEQIFRDYQGHVLIDDTFETHTVRSLVFRDWLQYLGYDVSNISCWTNGPNYDHSQDYDNQYIRHNWLHLCEYGRYLSNNSNRIKDIEDIDALKSYKNKKYKALYLNGHSTSQREYLLGLFAENNALDDVLYSFRDPINVYSQSWRDATKLNRDDYIPKKLPDDEENSRTVRDRFKQDKWWIESFYNINVETNVNWKDHNLRLITEKWMKSILYYTPSFNIGDYHGLETYQKSLGFENYAGYLVKSYDHIQDWKLRCKTLVENFKDTPIPTEIDWQFLMGIAEHNYHHLHEKYIPNLVKTFEDLLEKVVDKSS